MRRQFRLRPPLTRRRVAASIWSSALLLLVLSMAWPLAGTSLALVPGVVTLSIVGTTDLHGRVFPEDGRGGLDVLGGFVANLRAARAADGGAVVLLDTGDTFQGGIESNLSEGALVIDAYNALGYSALALGNHDFEYGSVDEWGGARTTRPDRRGALKARAAQARFPFLAANLIDDGTGRPVDWPNVQPSVMIHAAGVRVGIVGVMTAGALSMTLADNVVGLTVAPLVATIVAEASALRANGAQVVIVAAHAGGRCTAFDRPADLSSCDGDAEMFEVVRGLPRGLVDVVVAGHSHGAVAHALNGVAIVQAYSWGRAFSRVDLAVDGRTGRVDRARIFPPREVCAREAAGGVCAPSSAPAAQPRYEGRPVEPDGAVADAMAPALRRVRELRATPLQVALDAAVTRGTGIDESPLGNLFADALRDRTPGSEVGVVYGGGPPGLRADLPAGPITAGALYDVFPFDNGVVRVTMTGLQLKHLIEGQMQRPRVRGRGRSLGVSGLRVRLDCREGEFAVALSRDSGRPLGDDEPVVLATVDFMAARAGPLVSQEALRPLMRESVSAWLAARGGQLRVGQFTDPVRPRWERTAQAAACGS